MVAENLTDIAEVYIQKAILLYGKGVVEDILNNRDFDNLLLMLSGKLKHYKGVDFIW